MEIRLSKWEERDTDKSRYINKVGAITTNRIKSKHIIVKCVEEIFF